MKIVKAILSTTQVDRHGDQMSEGALHSMAAHINSGWVPMGVEHDPRIAPVGRVLRAEVKRTEGEVFVLEGVFQQFEPGDFVEIDNSDREIPMRHVQQGSYEVICDRSFLDEEQKAYVDEIASILKVAPVEELKKAVEPVSVLTIAVGAAIGAFGRAFFSKLGEEAALALVDRIKRAFAKGAKRGDDDNLLVFLFSCEQADRKIEIQVILENPNPETIELFFKEGFSELDNVVAQNIMIEENLRRLVYSFDNSGLSVMYGVRKDAFPLYPRYSDGTDEGNC